MDKSRIRSNRGLSPHGRGKRVVFTFPAGLIRSIPARAGETIKRTGRRNGIGVYPRTGGGNLDVDFHHISQQGLSPHGRGKLNPDTRHITWSGSIPARAGETPLRLGRGRFPAVYPRTGGGNAAPLGTGQSLMGLSPHGRGKLTAAPLAGNSSRSIPARAGETSPTVSLLTPSTVYPRTGGGNKHLFRGRLPHQGLSPHGRGKRDYPPVLLIPARSIPARAGETVPLC